MATKQRKSGRRRYKPLTELNVLNMIRRGDLKVDTERGLVFSKRRLWKPLSRRTCPHGYLHVEIYYRGGRRHCPVSRVVWMAANRQPIPDGYQVHHGPRGRKVNGIDNLMLRPADEHGWYHAYMRSYELRKRFRTYEEYRRWRMTQPAEEFVFD